MINILWVTADRGACGSYRVWMPALSLYDYQVADSSFVLHDAMAQSTAADEMKDMDIVVFQRIVSGLAWEWMQEAKRLGLKIVFEMDDDIFDVPRHNPAGTFWWLKSTQKLLRRELELCDLVITSTEPLAQTVQTKMRWATRQKIRVAANHLHPAAWGRALWQDTHQFDNQGKIIIGWQGSKTHDRDFKEAVDAVGQILRENDHVMLRLFGDVPPCVQNAVPGDKFQWIRGVPFDKYVQTLRYVHFDIVLAPLTNSYFNQSKSNIRLLEAGAFSLPAVASRVYPYAQTIVDGETGFLVTRSDEWYTALQRLIDSESLREKMGDNARLRVWSKYGPHHWHSWADAFTSLTHGTHHGQHLHTPWQTPTGGKTWSR